MHSNLVTCLNTSYMANKANQVAIGSYKENKSLVNWRPHLEYAKCLGLYLCN